MSIIGLTIRLSRPSDLRRLCCEKLCTIHPGKGPHICELRCATCGRHRGWLSRGAAWWLKNVVKGGAPTGPITIPILEVALIEFRMRTGATRRRGGRQ
jgi:hypothetical protein